MPEGRAVVPYPSPLRSAARRCEWALGNQLQWTEEEMSREQVLGQWRNP